MIERESWIDIPGTITKFHNYACLLSAGRNILMEHLDQYPYHPTPDEFGDRVWQESGLNFWGVPGDQKEQAAAFVHDIWPYIQARVEEQQKYNLNPSLQKSNLIDLINSKIPPDVRLTAESADIAWGLFSFSLVLPKSDFDRITFFLTNRKPNSTSGYVSHQLIGNLGPIPIIRRGVEKRQTVSHEDIHVFQLLTGAIEEPLTVEIFDDEEFLAALDNHPIPGKLEKIEAIYNHLVAEAYKSSENELRASIWSREKPSSGFAEDPQSPFIRWSLTALFNQIYSQVEGLSEAEQIEKVYHAQAQINEIAYRREVVWEIVKASVAENRGRGDAWDWVAANVTLIPPESSIRFYKAVLLRDRHSGIGNQIQRYTSHDLAGAIVTHASRRIDPESCGQGGEIPKGQLPDFWNEIVRIFTSRELYATIINPDTSDPDDLIRVKQRLIKYACISAPQGMRGTTQRELNKH